MPYAIDETHDQNLKSWVESANDPKSDFPIQNLPLCEMVDREHGCECIDGVRIGDQILDLNGLLQTRLLDPHLRANMIGNGSIIKCFGRFKPVQRLAIRKRLVELLSTSDTSTQKIVAKYLYPASDYQTDLYTIGDYTDFYASLYHATNVGSMFRPDNPLLPNYKHIPIGYHGRASSIVTSGTNIKRPVGQQAPAEEGGSPGFGPCKLLDYEMEMGVIVGRSNELGEPVSIEDAEDHMLGLCILNDWSARDLQKWEYVPLGPFLAKNFASTVSPYIVTMEALAPFRCQAQERDAADPQPLPYMDSDANRKAGGFDIKVEVHIASAKMREQGMEPVHLSTANFKDMYWTLAQMLTHHTVNGCNLQPGDLLGSGTISGTTRDARGSMLELTWDGDPFANPPVIVPGTQRTPIVLPTGEERKFIADGDEIIMKAYCEREGFRRIGFGECRGIIEPAREV
ncbi:MAG: fumarylacetoacetase [Phycisphaerales bacterium]|nr:fumarylacetoacetase [Phycisphaerales bacterium]